jgi:hypothetical protein
MFGLKRGDVVFDLDKEPEAGTNRGKVEEILPNACASDLEKWHDERSASAKAQKSNGWIFAIPPSVRKEIKEMLLQMSDEEIDAEIARLDRILNWHGRLVE